MKPCGCVVCCFFIPCTKLRIFLAIYFKAHTENTDQHIHSFSNTYYFYTPYIYIREVNNLSSFLQTNIILGNMLISLAVAKSLTWGVQITQITLHKTVGLTSSSASPSPCIFN